MTTVIRVPLHAAASRVELTFPPASFIAVQRTDAPFFLSIEGGGALLRMEARGDKLEICGAIVRAWYSVDAGDVVAGGFAELVISGTVNPTLNGAA